MSSLTDPVGGLLVAPVSVQRSMTDEEVRRFLITGEMPDLSRPPTAEETVEDDLGLTDDEIREILNGHSMTAGGGWPTEDLVFRFDPSQPRDEHGRWAKVPGSRAVNSV